MISCNLMFVCLSVKKRYWTVKVYINNIFIKETKKNQLIEYDGTK